MHQYNKASLLLKNSELLIDRITNNKLVLLSSKQMQQLIANKNDLIIQENSSKID